MTEHHFENEITRTAPIAIHDAEALRERAYVTAAGTVRVRADWSAIDSEEPAVRVPLVVSDERTSGHARDLPAFVELFFHDAFLMFNIAAPGSFGGVIATSGGEYRVRELTLEPHLFAYARVRNTLELRDVVAWYDSLELGTQQLAENDVAKVLTHLLQLARSAEDDTLIVVRLAHALEVLQLRSDRLFALRDAICNGTAPVVHPMHDEVLDERLEDGALDWTGAIDGAANLVVAALQERVRSR